MTIKIVTDSSADLPPDIAAKWDIAVIPCYVIVEDRPYRDGVDISPDEFYSRLESAPRPPTTAQPAVADFQTAYEELLAQGHQIVSVHISRKLSGTVNSANQARAALGERGEAAIETVDSGLASIPLGLLVLSAAKRAGAAESHVKLAEEVRAEAPLNNGFFVLDTLDYLQKGGRIGKAQAFLGSVLNVKPILTLQEGEAYPLERQRNRGRALKRLMDLASDMAPVQQLAVIHSTEPERAEELRDSLSHLLSADEVITARFGPVLGTYLGPRALGVAFTRTLDPSALAQ